MASGKQCLSTPAVFVAAVCAAALSSCALTTPSASTSDELRAEARSADAGQARVSAKILGDHGLEELWYVPPPSASERDPRDGGILGTYLLPEGLVLVTAPGSEGSDGLMKFVSRKDGLTTWIEAINGAVTEAPFSYIYPQGSSRSSELFYRVYDTIHCLDLRYGARLWSKSMTPPISSRIVADEQNIYVGAANGYAYAYRKGSTTDQWPYRTGGPIEAAPVLAGGKVIFASTDGSVYALEPETGYVPFQSWRTQTRHRLTADLVAYSRWVFASSHDYKLYCLEASDGSVHWTFGAEAPILEAPVVYRYRPNEEYVYCVATGGSRDAPKHTLFAVPLGRIQGGTPGIALWRKEGVRRVVSIGKDLLYVLNDPGAAGEKSLAALDVKTGNEKFRIPLAGFNYVPTNLADSGRDPAERGKIYLVSRDGAVQTLREKD